MITMDDIIAFIERAMKKKFEIESGYNCIEVSYENKTIEFIQGHNCDKEVLVLRTDHSGKTHELEITKEDILKWKLLQIECANYQNEIAIEAFNNFFDKEEARFKDINDLDNEDD